MGRVSLARFRVEALPMLCTAGLGPRCSVLPYQCGRLPKSTARRPEVSAWSRGLLCPAFDGVDRQEVEDHPGARPLLLNQW